MSIQLSDTLKIPDSAVTETFAFIARRGAGKTYTALKLAEGMLDIRAQVIAFDPVGVWYSLRIAADGEGAGFDIPIFGGLRGDIPLEPAAGALIADLIVERNISGVLDVSMFRKNDRKRFATEFAEQLFHLKKRHRSPLHLFVEEAQVFVPQQASEKGGERDPKGGFFSQQRMLGAFEDLVKLGRNFGIGVTLISQRPQSVNKDALNQTEALFVLQTNGAHERKALEAWIIEQGVENKAIIDELPSLPTGTAYLWSPSWLRKLEKVQIGKRKTYDASATPLGGHGQKNVEPKPLSKQELAQVQQAMSATVARNAENDPKNLKLQIVDLKNQLSQVPAAVPKVVEQFVLRDETVAEAKALVDRMEAAVRSAERTLNEALRPLAASVQEVRSLIAADLNVARLKTVTVRPPRREKPPALRLHTTAGGGSLSRAERAVLSALAQHFAGCGKAALGILSGYSAGSGHFNNILGKLRSAELISRGEPIAITDNGLEALGHFDPLPTGAALQRYWIDRLGRAEGAILAALFDAHPRALSKVELGDRAGYSSGSGHFNNVLGKLRTLSLVEGYGEIRASAAFFEE